MYVISKSSASALERPFVKMGARVKLARRKFHAFARSCGPSPSTFAEIDRENTS
jgi:hypothetical protein